jgi:predicted HTH transcriptional regulator
MVRIDDTPVHKAIREAVVNMMIHSDYMITGVLKIVKFDNGFEFSNPGNLKLPVQSIYEGGHSVARNPRIQQMFRMIGLGDNIGSGFPTILNAWGEEQWRKPDLSQNEDLHQVELKLWMISLMPAECTEYLQKLYGAKYNSLDNEPQIILATAFLENGVSNARMQSILDMHSTDIGHILASLVEQNMLIADKKGRWTSYRINTDYEIEEEQYQLYLHPQEIVFKNESDRIIYEYVRANGFITSAQVQQISKIKSRQGASVALNRLIARGLIKMVHHGKSTYYELDK